MAWELWFTTRQSFKVEVTAQHSPLKSLNFAALKIKDAVADRFRHKAACGPTSTRSGRTCGSTRT